MSQVNPISVEAGMDSASGASKGAQETCSATAQGIDNGVPVSPIPTEPEQRPALKRAEALADRLALQVGVVSTVVTESLKRFFARAREEAEDLWAEAQHIRKGTKS